jgi:hypothetical protein
MAPQRQAALPLRPVSVFTTLSSSASTVPRMLADRRCWGCWPHGCKGASIGGTAAAIIIAIVAAATGFFAGVRVGRSAWEADYQQLHDKYIGLRLKTGRRVR